MLLWAIAPASEPATSLSAMPSVSWLLPINRLIWQMGHIFFCYATIKKNVREMFGSTEASCCIPARKPWTLWRTRVQFWWHLCRCLATVTSHRPLGSSARSPLRCACCCFWRHEPGEAMRKTNRQRVVTAWSPIHFSLSGFASKENTLTTAFHLHEDFEPVQRCCACSRHRTRSSPSH